MKVELEKYYGKWYEVARLPNWFQGDLWFYPWKGKRSTAEYGTTDDPLVITVTNKLEREFRIPFLKNIFSKKETAEGHATVKSENSFSVSFAPFSRFWVFGKPNYFVRTIISDKNGEYLFSVVTSSEGNEEQKYAWLLSRKDPEEWTDEEKVLAQSTIQMMELYGVKEKKLIKHSVLP